MAQALISLRQVSKIYRMGEVEVPALHNISLDIYDGEYSIILGYSGSGKSTLLNLIGGLDRPTSGEIYFQERNLSKMSDGELTRYRRYQIGFVFQFYNLVPTLTALENVQVSTEIAKNPLDPMEALNLVGLSDRADYFPSQLSGGQQQRVSIARAIASNPRILLCDEPTGALDVNTGKQVLSLLAELNQQLKKTVLLITHNSAISGIGHRIITLRDGEILSIQTNEHPLAVEQIRW